MVKASTDKAGIALLIVLSTIILVTLLALVMLRPLASHARLTHHQVSRIQAYYAALAGMNYAYDRLRVGDPNWPVPPPPNSMSPGYYLRDLRCDPAEAACTINSGEIDEVNFPHTIRSVLIAVAYIGATASDYSGTPIPGCNACTPPPGIPACICTTVDYTYIP